MQPNFLSTKQFGEVGLWVESSHLSPARRCFALFYVCVLGPHWLNVQFMGSKLMQEFGFLACMLIHVVTVSFDPLTSLIGLMNWNCASISATH